MQSTEEKLREACKAFEKRGTGFDSCPTRRLPQSDEAKQIDQWWLRYFMDADLSVRSLARQALALPTAAPVSSFEDQRVQAVYELLVDDMAPPPEEHWEGFVARRIVDKLFNPVSPASDRADFEKWAREQFYSGLACPSDTWSDDRKTYNDPAHHMAFCAFRAALSAGDAVDARRYRWLKGRSQVCLNQVWIGGYTTRQRDVDFLSKEDALSAIDTAIDEAMRKGQL